MRSPLAIVLLVLALCAIGVAGPVGRAAADPERSADRAGGDRAAPDAPEPASGGGERNGPGRTGPGRAVHGPPIDAVLAAAYAAGGLDRDLQGSWAWRTRIAGLIPWITVRTARDTSWQDAHAEVGHGASLDVRATWRLDRLLFDSKELQIATIDAARRRERRRLAAQVIRAYFAWRRAAGVAIADERAAARLAETVAELDAVTDGWFSAQLAKP